MVQIWRQTNCTFRFPVILDLEKRKVHICKKFRGLVLKKNPYVCLLLRKNAKSRVLFKIRFFK